MNDDIEADLRAFLEDMYQKYGHNKTTVAISQILDNYIVEAQRERYELYKSSYRN